jgi:hypothetical protein
MPQDTDYIPGPDGKFNDFQANLSTYVAANFEAWGIPQKALDDIAPIVTRWNNAWAIAKNKDTRSPADVKEKDLARKELDHAIRAFVKEFLANNSKVSNKDRTAMGLTVPSGSHSPRPAISTPPAVIFRAVIGGTLHVECRVEHDASRASMHPDADIVEIRYKMDDPAPTNLAECTQIKTSTRGSFTMELGIENAGKRLYGFARWANESDNSKSGPWTNLFAVFVA